MSSSEAFFCTVRSALFDSIFQLGEHINTESQKTKLRHNEGSKCLCLVCPKHDSLSSGRFSTTSGNYTVVRVFSSSPSE
ncbi:hypothetical protein FOZ63_026114 [Perkinsus olseni]|uniref:Uncharacterized protein n=1 Tax=Perkinsus olseni TaxID=32597 RepID=A0A7J6T5J9_PEROL|nr:hypothetical protein FOZ60_010235 [Perkinsus olseni]KAF4724852.1 hypothetical protein FOZ63_026114 [Perkinsus olseni]KAF4740488.1 hypothetical protein FOZ62_001706 [Perkinsus olseni]